MKGKILNIGYIDENNKPQRWAFDCLGTIPAQECTADGIILYAGYTILELKDIAIKAIAESDDLV